MEHYSMKQVNQLKNAQICVTNEQHKEQNSRQESGENQELSGSQEVNSNQELSDSQEVNSNQELSGSQEENSNQELSGSQEVNSNQELSGRQEVNSNQELGGSQEVNSNQELSDSQEVNSNQELSDSQEVNSNQELSDRQGSDCKLEDDRKQDINQMQESKEKQELSGRGENQKKKKKKRFIVPFILAALTALVLIVYGSVAIYYQSHFLPNTEINGMDCSNLDVAAVVEMLIWQSKDYTLEIIGRNADGEKESIGMIRANDIDLGLAEPQIAVNQLLDMQNPLLWINAFFHHRTSHSLMIGVTFDEDKLAQTLKAFDACQKKNMIEPEDAYISEYSEIIKGYEIMPETLGTKINIQAMKESVAAAVYDGSVTEIDLEEYDCYERAKITSEDKKLLANLRTMNKWVNTEIVYDWNGNEVIVDGELIKDWVSLEGNKPKLNEEAIAEFVAEKAKEFDTYGKKRKFMTTLGIELTLPSGAYGWKTDRDGEKQELIQAIEQGVSQEKEPLYISKGGKKGSNDIGSSYVEIDLSNQHLYLYQDGNIVLETDFVSGNMSNGCMTPPGVFGLTYKTKNAVLRGQDYETPVNYWMPFNGNVGMHDATWRGTFGGDIYLTSGSHGCVNLPLDMAAAIYDYVSTGFPVICYYY